MREGWMVGRDGRLLTDLKRRDEGVLRPIGGSKGYGLAIAIGLLAGTLNGAAFGSDVVDFAAATTSPTNTGQFVAAIDIRAFGAPDVFRSTAARVFAEMRRSPLLPGHDPVRVLADGRNAAHEAGLPYGIVLLPLLRAELDRIARDLDLAPL